jgi:hypothetical protein
MGGIHPPLASAVAATVNAWDSFSGDSMPVVSLMISWRGFDGIGARLRSGPWSSNSTPTCNAGARMYGLADSQLFWVMDMAAVGQGLQSHVSAQLKRVG